MGTENSGVNIENLYFLGETFIDSLEKHFAEGYVTRHGEKDLTAGIIIGLNDLLKRDCKEELIALTANNKWYIPPHSRYNSELNSVVVAEASDIYNLRGQIHTSMTMSNYGMKFYEKLGHNNINLPNREMLSSLFFSVALTNLETNILGMLYKHDLKYWFRYITGDIESEISFTEIMLTEDGKKLGHLFLEIPNYRAR